MDYETPEIIQRFFPGAWGGNDRDGRPMYVLRLGELDVRGLMKTVHFEEVWIRHVRIEMNNFIRILNYFCLVDYISS
jgi:hypothetical protein